MGDATGVRARAAPGAGDGEALRAAWCAVWVSRLLVWVAGLGGVAALGRREGWRAFDPEALTAPFGPAANLLAGPGARWDSVWYLAIAQGGYAGASARAAFFPLYPLAVAIVGAPARVLGGGSGALLVAGVLVSVGALLAGLVVVHRLAVLELGREPAALAVALVALFPTAFAFSAVYSESLFLALSAGALYAGRLGRWRWAGLLGALAAATRNTGVLLIVPLALLYLYGPRADRPTRSSQGASLRPRHPVGRDLAWLVVVPIGLGAYLVHLAVVTGDPLAPFQAGELWYRRFAGPLGGIWQGAVAALAGARQLGSGSRDPVLFAPAAGDPYLVAAHNIGDLAFLAFAIAATVGVLRRLPVAYGAWVVCALAVPLSYPVGPEPLASVPRYLAVLFPLHMWLAAWASERRLTRPVLGASAVGLALLSAAFSAWQWVA